MQILGVTPNKIQDVHSRIKIIIYYCRCINDIVRIYSYQIIFDMIVYNHKERGRGTTFI